MGKEKDKEKKKFRDTDVGRFLKEKLPNVLDKVSSLTGIEALSVVSKLISGEDLSNEDRLELQRLILEQQQLELDNVVSARDRESRVVEALGKPDYAQWTVGAIGLLISCAVIYKGLFGVIDDKEVYFHLLGIIEGAVLLSIFNYYFGQMPGYRNSDNKLINFVKKEQWRK